MISPKASARDSVLFVYGTLRPFFPIAMARWLSDVGEYLGPASTSGRLYDLGPYPGFRWPQRRGERVLGDLYRVRNAKLIRVLDRYEAGTRHARPRFVRQRCAVMHSRRRRAAWLYVYRPSVRGKRRIVDGDYRAFCERRSAARLERSR